MSMEDSYSENHNYQLQEDFIQRLDFNSPRVTPEIAEPPLNDAGFQMEADEERQDLWNDQGFNTLTYDTTNSNHSSIDTSMIEEVMNDNGPYEDMQTFKSQQIVGNSAMVSEGASLSVSKSAEIYKEPKNYQEQVRKDKVDRYLSKKEHRNFEKRVMYESRKRVADERLRIGGRFQKQASQQKAQLTPIQITPKKPRQTIGKNETFAQSHTKSSVKSKR